MKIIFALLCVTACLLACGPNKADVLAKYQQLDTFVDHRDYQSLYSELDQKSQAFIQELVNEKEIDYQQSRKLGNRYRLPLFCAIYAFEISREMDQATNKESLFLHYLSLSDLPILGSTNESTVHINNAWVGDESFVLANQVIDEHMTINQKVIFTQDSLRNFKLDLLSLLKLNESQLKLQYDTFLKEYAGKLVDSQKGYDMLPYFLENRDTPMKRSLSEEFPDEAPMKHR